MEARHLSLLRELAERGSLTAVAQATHRTLSAVSQQVRTAERDLGVRLIEPRGRGVRLTPAGRTLAEAAVEVDTALERAQARLDTVRHATGGEVRVAGLPSALEYLAAPVASRLAQESPRIELLLDDLDVAEVDFAVATRDTDIVIGHSLSGPVPQGSEMLVCTQLVREPIDVALPAEHALAARSTVAPADLVGLGWVGVPVGYPFDTVRLAIESSIASDDPDAPPMRVVQRVRDNRVVAVLVRCGAGVALLPRFTCADLPGLVLRPLVGVPATRWIVALMRPERAERAAVRRVVAALRDAAPSEDSGSMRRDG